MIFCMYNLYGMKFLFLEGSDEEEEEEDEEDEEDWKFQLELVMLFYYGGIN